MSASTILALPSPRHPPAGALPCIFRALPDPLPFEPAHGWAWRAAAENQHPSMTALAFQYGLELLDPPTCLALAKAAGAQGLAALAASTPAWLDGRFHLRGEAVSVSNLSVQFRRHCPACLAESVHHRFFWDLAYFETCPFHGTAILGGRWDGKVSWSSTDLCHDQNGNWLLDEAPRLSAPRRSFELYALGRFGIAERAAAPMLDRTTLDDAAWCVALVGSLLTRTGEDISHSRHRLRLGPDVLGIGFDALSGDASWLKERLSHRAGLRLDELDPREQAGIGKLFGRSTWLAFGKGKQSRLGREIFEAMQAVTASVGRVKASPLGTKVNPRHGMLTFRELVKETDLPADTLRHLLELGGIRDVLSRRFPAYYSLEDASLVRRVVEATVPAEEAAAALGLQPRDLYTLESAGILRTITYDRGTKSRGKRYHKPDVDLVVERFGADFEPQVASMSFLRVASDLGVTRGELARRVVLGEIVPVGRRGRGPCFKGMRFAAAGQAGAVEPGMSARQASLALEVKIETLRWLVAEGHLGAVGPSLRNGGIEKAAVERLSSLYVSTSVLAPRMGATHGAKAAAMLEEQHVEVLRPNPYSLGLALRSDVEVLDPGLLAPGPVDRAWESLRSCVGPGCGAWEFPKSMRGGQVTFRMSEGKVFASLEIGDSLVLSVDCSPVRARRRWRTLEPVLGRLPEALPEFRLERGEGIVRLWSEIVLPAPFEAGEDACRWFEKCLSALADLFAGRPAGRIPDPEREQRRAEGLERSRRHLRAMAQKGGSRRKAPTRRAEMLRAIGIIPETSGPTPV